MRKLIQVLVANEITIDRIFASERFLFAKMPIRLEILSVVFYLFQSESSKYAISVWSKLWRSPRGACGFCVTVDGSRMQEGDRRL